MRKFFKKLKKRSGFSLTELLVTVIILSLMSAVAAQGIASAYNVTYKNVDASNAQVLLSTAMTELRSELGYATDISVNGKTLTYSSSTTGNKSELSVDNGNIVVKDYIEYSGTIPRRNLVSAKAATDTLGLDYDSVSYKDNTITFKNLKVISKTNNNTLVQSDFVIKATDNGD